MNLKISNLISPHPDDETIAGATIAKFVKNEIK